ncbi:IclR family transcriptional regulator [uncultured Tateyamaria sp.]|uniref:IclR family transcriptional regulator n=1 Tax=uncultured Tateyamaria sp. TaxID=455651 RepID=UPI0026104FFB|nr:IclR family transcriptional regulator [uncultured Tateyamaria sp.]
MTSSIVQKLMSLVTVISEARTPLTFSELVEQTGLNKSTLHRLLSIAADEQLVQHVKGSKVYLLGPKVFDLVRNAYSGYDIQAVALDEMMRLHAQFDGNVTLGVPNGTDVVYLRLIEAKGSLGGIQRPGMREPVHCSASGKALMAYLPPAVCDAMLSDHVFERFTERTITDADTFRAALREVRAQGFAANDREEYDHFLGISAPIFNYMGDPIAVLNIWTVHTRHSIDDIMGWSEALIASAQEVTRMIGGKSPD